ncbi:DUF4349 domain-containing protein [Aquimarina mytili]|uniref:DUF4349 domain-containing protein n=1 Tax=Aquimarina mytili TaxID=874423 RepID=A0A936ZVH6_9FLAO|nr:DUF4349 domain-containing protein [Aquimarina mytili]MBL0685072.1 DUF4349 domain-containing protein [Aquimarina mytili]
MKSNKLNGIKEILLIGTLILSFSCSKQANTSEMLMLDETGETPSLNTYEAKRTEPQEREHSNTTIKIIKNATSRMKVKSVEEATWQAKQIAAEYQGYVSDERYTNTNHTKENRFTIRVPQKHFDTVFEKICKTAEFVEHKNISTIDVTEEYVDLNARLKTKLEVKQRYETILRTKAKNVEDILATEEKLKDLQEEIESAQGRLNHLSSRVVFSTIQLDVYELVIPKEEPEQYTPGFLDKAKVGLSFGWSLIQNFALILFYIWPFLVLGLLIFVYFKWIRK